MLTSLGIIFLFGLLFALIAEKLKMPRLLGMLILGILVGPFGFNLLDKSILSISADLRKFALVIILIRAGLSLDINDLKIVGRPAILMCFLPATLEIIGMIVLAPKLLGISVLDAAIIGTVVGAVSPAVIVPKMIHLIENKYGTDKGIPQMILAGASVDDVYVIVIFTSLISLAKGSSANITNLLQVPISIILGVLIGFIVGYILVKIFKMYHMRDSVKTLVLLSISFFLLQLEITLEKVLPISGLLAIMSMGIFIYSKYEVLAKRLSVKFSKLWLACELLLFVLVGACMDIRFALNSGVFAVVVIFGALIFRVVGVFLSIAKTNLNLKERIFCAVAYTPKATVQAAICSIPLNLGLSCGNIVLTIGILAIIITAPLGSFLIDLMYKKALNQEN